MRLTTRTDLGGYAASKGVADVEVTEPFVLFCGPNGSGKTALLRMIRNATGLWGERAGFAHVEQHGPRPVEVREGDVDLGRIAAHRLDFGREGMPRESPGVVDVRALGWRGQRTWLFDSRAETLRFNPSVFETGDMMDHVQAMMSAKQASHGEAIRRGWTQAMHFAAGVGEHADPYDATVLPPHLAVIRDALFEGGVRSVERWLFLDEPETAVDANALMMGLALMLDRAEPGRLRVFCASHSPLFAAGLAEHPKVQVVEVGPVPWLERQRLIYEVVRDGEKLARIGSNIAADLKVREALDQAERIKREVARRKDVLASLSATSRSILLAALDAPDGTVSTVNGRKANQRDEGDVNGMRRGPRLIRWDGGSRSLRLTDEGRAMSEALREAGAAPEPARKARASKPRMPPARDAGAAGPEP